EKDFSAVRGDILWSDTEQRGYMRFFGLPANDPTVSQYQLWIVDPSRDEHPIDGGVFDVSVADGEVIVEFESRLPADAPAVFAVTVEKPGGVVVSDGPLVLVASKSS
ncbi:MAG: anti-sigma factor, partial [Phycisphaerae bacterium]